ncbi:DUF3159 domain-containing protein [Nakamurella endophytica]|uniref:DUF3159 domain-containing protein n=1 Tax=Nakamurella endophytica TaxID=1748367 RepID=A0A917T5N3_9ACTN|nr:DUF3159 domain-containing protein [Nakamurella endophytica]GGM12070.1 hypothetical protein GCM10011594_34880 [Nakamurella endophytica]
MSHPHEPAGAPPAGPLPAAPGAEDGAGQAAARTRPTLWDQLGGPMGMVDSGLPVVVFVIVNAFAGLGWAIGSSLACGAVIAAWRLIRRKPVMQAIGGLIGVGVAAFIAYRTGSAKGYFLFGIWSFVVYGAGLVLSILVRWPLVGVVWEGLNGRGMRWRQDRSLVRRYDAATAVWVLVFVIRFVVQRWLYDTDKVGWLATARLVMGYPMWFLAIVATVLIVGSAAGMHLPWRRRAAGATASTTASSTGTTTASTTVSSTGSTTGAGAAALSGAEPPEQGRHSAVETRRPGDIRPRPATGTD